MSKYRDNMQNLVVIDGVKALLNLGDKHNRSHLSMETLCLIFNAYVSLVEPNKVPTDKEGNNL